MARPLLYQVATVALNPSDVTVLLSLVTAVDVTAKRVITPDGDIPYDCLIVATGATHSYFAGATVTK